MDARGFRSAGHTPSLVAALIHFDISFMVWVLLGALGAFVAADLGLSPLQSGLMVAVPPLGGSVFRLVVGTLADRVGVKRTGLVSAAGGVGGFLLPFVLGALRQTTGSFGSGFVVLGVAAAADHPVRPSGGRVEVHAAAGLTERP